MNVAVMCKITMVGDPDLEEIHAILESLPSVCSDIQSVQIYSTERGPGR